MSEEVFKKVIQEVRKANIQEVMLSPDLGEPTLAPAFIEKVEVLRAAGVKKVECTTNAIALHKVGIDAFLDRGPDVINISTAGFDESMFRRIYRCEGFETMKQNILELLEKNSKRAVPKEINVWLRIDIPVEDAVRLQGMDIVMRLANDVGWMTEADSWNGRITQEMLPGTMRLQRNRQKLTRRPCRTLLSTVIRVDGSVHACSCRNIANDPALHLGSVMREDLFTCFRMLARVIEKWKNGIFPLVCRGCDMYADPRDRLAGYIIQRIKDYIR
jgi:hypothetical protein